MSVLRSAFTSLERLAVLDPVAEKVAAVVHRVLPDQRVADLLHGRWLGHPTHPILVQVPIGAWVSATALDLMPGGRTAARRLVGLGLLAAPAALAAGWADWAELEPEARRVGLVHAGTNAIGIACYLGSYRARRNGRQAAGVTLSLLGLTAIGAGGALGGHLAYAQAAGANHAESALRRVPEGWHDVGPLADLPAGKPVRRDVGASPVVLYRAAEGSGVYALAAECTHVGGPLQDGEVTEHPDGPRISCPWHGSEFRLSDGDPRRGPATACQPRFDVAVADGRVRVKATAEGSRWE